MGKVYFKKHNKLWFENRIGKKVYCNDHYKGDYCKGILIDNDFVAENLLKSGNERYIKFTDNPPSII